jgi:hypothetical protein
MLEGQAEAVSGGDGHGNDVGPVGRVGLVCLVCLVCLAGSVGVVGVVGLVSLGQEHEATVVPEVGVSQLGMSVEPEADNDELLEMPSQEIGQIERAGLGLV